MTTLAEVEALEIDLLLEAIWRHSGYDFRDYARASLTRRIRGFLRTEGLATVSELQGKVLHDPACLDPFILALTVHTSEMFRDPGLYRALRAKVVPFLRTYSFVRIWCAGCSTGEEVYSLAILLEEEGMLDRCRIYATDVDEGVVAKAKDGVFPLSGMQQYTKNYLAAGGAASFSSYYTAAYERALFLPTLRQNIVFARHNLVTDASFSEFHLILCRNVMIYFNRDLQSRVHNLLFDSLARLGTLALGGKESLQLTPHQKDYVALDEKERLYRRVH